jgi:hypothetical protein
MVDNLADIHERFPVYFGVDKDLHFGSEKAAQLVGRRQKHLIFSPLAVGQDGRPGVVQGELQLKDHAPTYQKAVRCEGGFMSLTVLLVAAAVFFVVAAVVNDEMQIRAVRRDLTATRMLVEARDDRLHEQERLLRLAGRVLEHRRQETDAPP